MAPSFSIRVNEATTFRYSGTLLGDNSSPLVPADLASMTCTLFDQDTGTIINGRNGQNIINANNFTLSNAGLLEWVSLPADSPIVDASKDTEIHVAFLVWRYGTSGTLEGTKEISIRVVNLARVS